MQERPGRYSVGVGFRCPVTMRKASLIGLSSRCVCALRLHTGARQWSRQGPGWRYIKLLHVLPSQYLRIMMEVSCAGSSSGVDT